MKYKVIQQPTAQRYRPLGGQELFDQLAGDMSHQQMVDEYRRTKPGDPWGDYLAARIQQPQNGETPEQASIRSGGRLSTATGGLSTAGQIGATILQGIPFAGEYTDEAAGALAPYISNNSAQAATDAVRQGQTSFANENPKSALGLKVVGGAAATLPAVASLPAQAFWTPATLAGRMAYGAGAGSVLGASEGAVSGYGAGEDAQSREQQAKARALSGGLVGGILGGLAPPVGDALRSGGKWVMDQFNVARNTRAAGLSGPSREILVNSLEADGSLAGRGAQRIAAAGPDAMLADAGPNARSVLDTAIQRSGPGGNAALDAIEQRAARANDTVRQSLDTTLGTPQGIGTAETAIRKGSASARQTAYDAAYSQPIDYASAQGRTLQQMLRRVPGNVIAKANQLMQIEGNKSRQILAQIQPDGSVVYKRLPDVRQWDYITRAINLAAETGEGAGAMGGQTALGRAFQNLSRDARSLLRNMVPEYGKALDTAAEPIAARQALRFGETIFSRGVTRDEVATTVQGMSQAERRQAAHGLRAFIDEKLANVTRAVTDGNMDAREAIAAVRDLSSRANRDKLASLVGQQEASRLLKAVDRATMSLELRAGVAANSKTFARLQMDKTIQDATDSGVVSAIRSGEPINAGRRIVQALLGGTKEAKQKVQEKVYQELVTALTANNPQQILANLQSIAVTSPRNKAIVDQVVAALGASIGVPAYQLGSRTIAEALAGPRQRTQ